MVVSGKHLDLVGTLKRGERNNSRLFKIKKKNINKNINSKPVFD